MLMAAVRLESAGLDSQGSSLIKKISIDLLCLVLDAFFERVQRISKSVQGAWLVAPATVHEPLTWTSMEKGLHLRVEAVLTL